MTDDIVTRLRVLNHHAKKIAENESLHDLYRDAFTRCENLTWEAADEIERMRAVVEAWLKYSQRAERDIETLRKERDEARRETCYELSGWKQSTHEQEARAEAKRRGWNCFKEATDGK